MGQPASDPVLQLPGLKDSRPRGLPRVKSGFPLHYASRPPSTQVGPLAPHVASSGSVRRCKGTTLRPIKENAGGVGRELDIAAEFRAEASTRVILLAGKDVGIAIALLEWPVAHWIRIDVWPPTFPGVTECSSFLARAA